MPRRTKAEAEQTRMLILDAAVDLFYEKGVSATSLADIAARAGLTRGAIYWHFRNKVDLFNAIHARVTLPLAEMRAGSLSQPDPLVALSDYWMGAIRDVLTTDRKRRIIQVLFRKCEYVEDLEGISRHLDAWAEQTVSVMTEAFTEARQKHLLASGIAPDVAACSAFSFVTGILYWATHPCSAGKCEEVERAVALFFTALRRSNETAPAGAA